MQADGLNELATQVGERGDDGDPFPGSTNNVVFSTTSTPNSRSYSNEDTFVSISNISPPGECMTMNIAVKPTDVPSAYKPAYH